MKKSSKVQEQTSTVTKMEKKTMKIMVKGFDILAHLWKLVQLSKGTRIGHRSPS